MKWWLSILALFVLASVPAAYLYADVLIGTNQVTITAEVVDLGASAPATESNTPSSTTSSGGGSGSGIWHFITSFFGDDSGTVSGNSNTSTDGTSDNGTNASGISEAGSSTETTATDSTNTEALASEIPPVPTTSVRFGGYTFPNAIVTFTLDGATAYTIQADADGYFEGAYSAVEEGEHAFTFQAQDYADQSSRLTSYVYTVLPDSPVYIAPILLPPIFGFSSTGELSGTAIPGSTVQVYGVDTATQDLFPVNRVEVSADGTFSYDIDLKNFPLYDQYYVSCEYEGKSCGYSGIIQVQAVGESASAPTEIFADFTQDVRVNYVDFSFMRAAFLNHKNLLLYDLNQDGKIDLQDFSLLNYQWTQ